MILPLSPANKVTNEVMIFSFALVLSALYVGTKKRNFSVSLICISSLITEAESFLHMLIESLRLSALVFEPGEKVDSYRGVAGWGECGLVLQGRLRVTSEGWQSQGRRCRDTRGPNPTYNYRTS